MSASDAIYLHTVFTSAVQFHTGLGDADITLTRSSPALLQPLIVANPRTTFVLLHASYPYMREAGYLTAMYKNVYLDIGEVFPVVSRGGQEALMQQVLELVPTNKIMWSSEIFFNIVSSPRNGNVEGYVGSHR
jgi:predicted TIM-barrel fold metal-dependent hydrolase